ncbi:MULTISPECIES: hypothetical protein [unclassified Streptomyces]|uniref:hypothetical protein n=1 Tax=unclassified Streptomyces TaxID=2593676 RepID=UPI001368F0AE|nr:MULTISPECIES: hypothetical protein [unclassified Streptomyces]MYS21338.1 hypothetical protein [Streptomyces sp. SID4948]
MIQHNVTARGVDMAAPESEAAVRRGTARTISAPPGPAPSGTALVAGRGKDDSGRATTLTPDATTRVPARTST